MMKRSTILLLFLSVLFFAEGKDKAKQAYPIKSIPENLKKDAFAVYRSVVQEFELTDYGKATEKITAVVTILNGNGDHFAEIFQPYNNKISKITTFSGLYYNEDGSPGEKFKSSEITDENYDSGGALYDDARFKRMKFRNEKYPYTFEYQVQIEHSGTLGYPSFYPIDNYRVSVENAVYRFIRPENIEIRYREFNLPQGCRQEKAENGKKILEWKIDSLEAIKEEYFSPDFSDIVPKVLPAPTRFAYDGTTGEMGSWKLFGDWVKGLNSGLDQLPENRKNEIRQMIGEVRDTFQAVSTLYKYMQKRTRYVGIQLGIGGFKPFPAETVDRLGYGDCKALSNYMKALLNCAGIPSVYVIAGAGPNQGITMPDFPTASQNNHAILCVPQINDTIWLECTSQKLPCGYTSQFTAGRTVMLITPDGGKLAPVPVLDTDKSFKSRKTIIDITQQKTVDGTVRTLYSGYQYDEIDQFLDKGKEEQEKIVLERLGIPGIKLKSLKFTENPERVPVITETISFTTDLLVNKMGTRLFVPVNFMLSRPKTLVKNESRKFPIKQKMATLEKDSTYIRFQGGFQVENAPKDKTISSTFGTYSTKVIPEENQILVIRELKVNKGEWPKEKHADLVDFYAAISANDKINLVLKEKQP